MNPKTDLLNQNARRLNAGLFVIGLPRSGTSLAMRIVEALGVPVKANQVFDRHNPNGYYEGHWTTSGIESSGRAEAAKVILGALETSRFQKDDKFILCLRNPYEVAYSQAKDCGKFGSEQPERNLNSYLAGLTKFLEWRKDRKVFILDHASLQSDPVGTVSRLAAFIGNEASEDKINVAASLVKKHPALAIYEGLKNDSL
jgi:hypothetical protein